MEKKENGKKAILYFDIDGTLTRPDTHTVPESTAEAIRLARRNGHIAVVNTGRPYTHIDPCVFDVGFDGYLCACGLHVRFRGETLLDIRLTAEECAETRELSRAAGIPLTYESDRGMFWDATLPQDITDIGERERLRAMGVPVSSEIDGPDFRFEKFLAWKSPLPSAGAFYGALSERFRMIDRGDFYECLPKGYSKATSMALLEKRLLPERYDTYAFGDSTNDLEMLNAAKTGVAMGNAAEAVKRAADAVTDSVFEDGIRNALLRFGLTEA